MVLLIRARLIAEKQYHENLMYMNKLRLKLTKVVSGGVDHIPTVFDQKCVGSEGSNRADRCGLLKLECIQGILLTLGRTLYERPVRQK